jgi:hypothetical protein
VASDEEFLGDLNEAMRDRPLDLTIEPDRKLYVPVYDALAPEDDPVRLLVNQIRRSRRAAAAHLFSGYRGSGKSTELRRLQNRLRELGFDVVYVDLDEYLDPFTPVEVGDYLLDVAGAFDDAVRALGPPGVAAGPTFWERLGGWLRSWEFAVDEFSAEVGGVAAKAGLKVSLKENPTFRRRLAEHLSHRLEFVVKEIHDFVADGALALQAATGSAGVVMLVDSTEKLGDTDETGDGVKSSVRSLFAQHAHRLRFPGVQCVYSIPPDLPIREPRAVSANYDGAIFSLTAITVEKRSVDGARARHQPGVDALVDVLRRRAPDVERLFGTRDALDEIVCASGGNLRNLLFLVRQVISRTFDLPASPRAVAGAVKQLTDDYKWLTGDEKRWLAQLVATGQPRLDDEDDRVRFADFLDRQVVLPYRNGDEWFDVLPPVRALVG